MTPPRDRSGCDWVLERVEPYIDEELSGSELEAFERHTALCDDCREEIALARRVAGELRQLPAMRCPDRVVEEALERVGAGAAPSWKQRIAEWLGRRRDLALRPAMAAMLIVIVAAAAFVLLQHDQSPFRKSKPEITQAEAEQVKQEVMLAFAYLGKYTGESSEIAGKELGEVVADEVIGKQVVAPVRRAASLGTTEPSSPR